MSETEFITLALRYLDGEVNEEEVDKLGAAMLESPNHRTIYRDLIHQSQLAHEWQSTTEPRHQTSPISYIAIAIATTAVAAAAIALLAMSRLPDVTPPSPQLAASPNISEVTPSWDDIYASVFNFPDFVWHSEFVARADNFENVDPFSEFGATSLDTSPAQQFAERLEPIALMPSFEPQGGRWY